MKRIIIALVGLVVVYAGMNYLRKYIQEKDYFYQQQIEIQKNKKQDEINAKEKELIELRRSIADLRKQESEKKMAYHFLAVGDIMMDRGVERVLKKHDKTYHASFDFMRPVFEKADYVFANLEGSLSDVGKDQGSKYSFRFEPAVADALKKGGLDMVSLANNHILDWGRDSACATTKNLAKVGVEYVGAGCNREEAEREKMVKLGNTNIAIIAYSQLNHWMKAGENIPGTAKWDPAHIKKRIRELKERADIDLVFVSVHWGDEYKNRAPEWVVKYGRSFVDAGADLIIGHHPHVDQEVERYGDGWIVYSLGNFIFDQSWSPNTMEGLMVDVSIQNKKILDVAPSFLDLNKMYQPQLRTKK